MINRLMLILSMMLISQFVFANEQSPTPNTANITYKKGALCNNQGGGIFKCVGLGDLTIPEIYAKGYRVVATLPNGFGGYIFIEEQ